jgi:hypothetical protein
LIFSLLDTFTFLTKEMKAINRNGVATHSPNIFDQEPKQFKKKEYVSANGSIVKSTLDTGAKKKKSKPNKKKELISPIQTTRQGTVAVNPHRLMRQVALVAERVAPVAIARRQAESPKRPFSLPLIAKKGPPILTEMEPLRSSTGDKPRFHSAASLPHSSSFSSLLVPLQDPVPLLVPGSLTLEIDIASDETVTKKEKRQWREFKTLTEDHHSSDDHSLLDLVRLNSIGKGSSASVYKSVLFPSLQVIADKVVVLSNKDKSSQIVRELRSLKAALQSGDTSAPSCPSSACEDSIVKLLDVFPNPRDGTISMCLEYMNGGSLQEVVRAGGCQHEAVLAGISTMILTGIAHLHSKRQLHRDIKPGNILLTSGSASGQLQRESRRGGSRGRVKISDFGLSKELEKGHSLADSFLGTFHYMSP